MLFERYDGYHGSFRGNLAWVDFKIVPGATALELYERDEIDILYPYHSLSSREARRAIQLHPDEYITEPDPMTTCIAFDVTRPPFDDLRVRQALILATDRDTLANRLTLGLYFPAGGGFVPPGVVGHAAGIALPYDPVAARQKLAEAGYPGGQGLPPITGICAKWGGLPEITDHLATQWKTNLGLGASFEHLDASDLINRFENDLPNLWLRGWLADYPDPDSFLRYISWLPKTGWRNEDYDKLVEEARHITNQSRRMAMYRQAEQILVDESPVMPLHYGRVHVLIKPWIPSLPASIINGNILKDVIIEPH
jgi:ABC-type oligopeptide transport system substrate-binding subunit